MAHIMLADVTQRSCPGKAELLHSREGKAHIILRVRSVVMRALQGLANIKGLQEGALEGA